MFPTLYPSLVDHGDTTVNVERAGRNAYLYYTRFNDGGRVNSINGLENDCGGAGNPRAGSPKFRERMTALQESQTTGGVGFRVKAMKDKQVAVMFIRPPMEEAAASSRRIRALLELEEDARDFHVESGSFPADKTKSRSCHGRSCR